MRIAVGGIHTECSTYSPVLMQTDNFRTLRGDELSGDDYFEFLKQHNAVIVPLLHARAIPGGPVARDCYESLRAEFLERLQAALPIDAVYLAMHGAMKIDGMFDAEADWIGAVRNVIGPDTLLAVSYDLHGNVSQRIVDAIDIFAAYRTAPHIDVTETMDTAFTMLMRALNSGTRPGVVRATIPMLLPGERSSTEDEPARSLYAALPSYENKDVWRTDLMIGYVWADEPRATAAAIVTGTDQIATKSAAEQIAASFWAARNEFSFGSQTGSLEEMLDIAEASPTSPVILADSGDNPTGGGVGDRADVLAALLKRNWQDAIIAGITDEPATTACFDAGEGAELILRVGASLDPGGLSINAPVRVVRLVEGDNPADRQAVIRIKGITVVLAARRRPYHNINDFNQLELDPQRTRLLVVKSGYLSPELAPIANPCLMALTEGVVSQDLRQMDNNHRPGGTLPFECRARFTPQATVSARLR